MPNFTNVSIVNAFISSAARPDNENTYNFNVSFPNNLIKANPENQGIKINVISFDMLNAMYNINSNNNCFQVYKNGTLFATYYIDSGNYSVLSLRNWLNTALAGFITVIYNTAQNTFTYTSTDAANTYKIRSINTAAILGLSNNIQLTIPITGYTGSYVNMVNFNKLIIRTPNISYEVGSVENLLGGEMKISSILFWVSKQNVEPFREITYNNEDAGNSFCYNIFNHEINNINFQLTNEKGEFITDAPDYLLGLQFIVYQRDEDLQTAYIQSMLQYIKDIYFVMLWFMEYFNII